MKEAPPKPKEFTAQNVFRNFLSYLLCDWIATAGAILVTTTAVVFLTFAFQSFVNPYYGILVFVMLPALFLLGLFLIPIGIWRCSRRPGGIANLTESQISGARTVRFRGLVALLTVVNVAIVSAGSYQSVTYMDSSKFCGTVCHTVMSPQYTTYQDSPHSRVECVSCHVGPGAQWFVHYKLSGLRQLYGVTFNNYHRPIAPANRNIRPAQDTCENCHSPQRLVDDKLRIIRRYDEDEKNTEKTTVLMLHIGTKIHKAHVGKDIEYVSSDAARQEIPWVSSRGVEFKSGNPVGERRKMDCIDCHNRPTHVFDTPAFAVDKAIDSGALDRSIPFAKRDAVLALTGKRPMDSAPDAVKKIFARNIWPEMSITWGSYPNNLGHDAFPGCFRCHDDNHKSSSGRTITQDCSACHDILAVGEEKPEILKQMSGQ